MILFLLALIFIGVYPAFTRWVTRTTTVFGYVRRCLAGIGVAVASLAGWFIIRLLVVYPFTYLFGLSTNGLVAETLNIPIQFPSTVFAVTASIGLAVSVLWLSLTSTAIAVLKTVEFVLGRAASDHQNMATLLSALALISLWLVFRLWHFG